MKSKRAQAALFIIIAIVVVAAALFFIFFWPRIPPLIVPHEVKAVKDYLSDCVGAQIKEGIELAGIQGGWIELPQFEPGSAYLPFSNQLSFLGMAIPYWWYLSGNNIPREQKPSLAEIEAQLARFLATEIKECDFKQLIAKGYAIEIDNEPTITVTIKAREIEALFDWPITVKADERTTTIPRHKISIKSEFHSLYETASAIFEAEQQQLFLENYSLDVLRLYAPVTGIELECAPKVWYTDKVRAQLIEALEGNIAAIKVKGTYYKIDEEDRYFEVDIGRKVTENVYFLFHRDMPFKFEVWPSEANLMKAEPIGIQPGLGFLGALGLCYLPYHFIYDIAFPVLVQINSEQEFFQFPMLVVISKNQARAAEPVNGTEIVFDICQFRSQEITVFSYDHEAKPLEAELWYQCFNQACPLGKTILEKGKKRAALKALVPQCYNGFLIARAANYSEARLQISSIKPFTANLFLKPRRILKLELDLAEDESAIINFMSRDYSIAVSWPEQQELELVEGSYNVTVQLFKEAKLALPAQKGEHCVKVPALGLAGLLGGMREECFELDIPAETLTTLLFGGGSTTWHVTDVQLARARKIKLIPQRLELPKNLEQLSALYGQLEAAELKIELR